MVFYIIDRRLNARDKSLNNSQRFKERAKEAIKKQVDEAVNASDSIKGLDNEPTKFKTSKVHEPTFHLVEDKGDFTYILPGNTKNENEALSWIEGDHIPKPIQGKGKGGGSADGDGEDAFEFELSEEEKYDLLFADLELPNQEETVKDAIAFNRTKAGYTSTGAPSNLALKKTMTNSLGRRLALDRPKMEELEILEKEASEQFSLDPGHPFLVHLTEQIAYIKSQMIAIPYIDPVDVKYFNIVKHPKPIFNAVMFCLMDVSGSMSETMKDLAKRFYILLYRFLRRKYQKVDVVFIRHHHTARTVDENDFFYARDTGGTVVSTALVEMKKHIEEKYNPKDWCIYAAQVSDGDNTRQDNGKVIDILTEQLLPITQYYAYMEVRDTNWDEYGYASGNESDLWGIYKDIVPMFPTKFAMKKAAYRKHIYPVFAELFAKRT